MEYTEITQPDQVNEIRQITQLSSIPVLIFKHSTRCSISRMVWDRLQRHWDFKTDELKIYYLDLLNYRLVSNLISEEFNVLHASPQVLLIKEGKCTWHTSHQDIYVDAIRNALKN
jgi:bacillithiol system protein YtxJ